MDTNDEDHEVYEFGCWPEVFGAVCVVIFVTCLLVFARGSL